MALNGISTEVFGDGSNPDQTKLLRRTDKLNLAAAKRSNIGTPGYRDYNTILGTHNQYVNGNLIANVSGTSSPTVAHPWSLAP